jgi:hypothetical protein
MNFPVQFMEYTTFFNLCECFELYCDHFEFSFFMSFLYTLVSNLLTTPREASVSLQGSHDAVISSLLLCLSNT